MKLIFKPSVYLVGQQRVSQEELDRFLSDHGVTWDTDSEVGGERLCETGGRLCYMSFAKPRPGGNKAYIDHIIDVGHGSVLEHAVWNLIFTGISRSLSHELVRHRVGLSPSQLSQRYVDESTADFVVPPDLQLEVRCADFLTAMRTDMEIERFKRVAAALADAYELYTADRDKFDKAAEAGKRWMDSIRRSQADYVYLSCYLSEKAQSERSDLTKTDARKFARQAARSVLPNATETKIFVTINARAARHFINLRANRHADPEIRVLAYETWKALVQAAPNLFSDYQETQLPDGTIELKA